MAMFQGKAKTVPEYLATLPDERGKKLDMGRSCLRFKALDDIPLDVVGAVIASTPVDKYIEYYRKSRTKMAKGK